MKAIKQTVKGISGAALGCLLLFPACSSRTRAGEAAGEKQVDSAAIAAAIQQKQASAQTPSWEQLERERAQQHPGIKYDRPAPEKALRPGGIKERITELPSMIDGQPVVDDPEEVNYAIKTSFFLNYDNATGEDLVKGTLSNVTEMTEFKSYGLIAMYYDEYGQIIHKTYHMGVTELAPTQEKNFSFRTKSPAGTKGIGVWVYRAKRRRMHLGKAIDNESDMDAYQNRQNSPK